MVGEGAIYGLQGTLADLAPVLPFGYAYAAGMVAAVNPCGVLFLPSVMAYYLGSAADQTPSHARIPTALALGLAATGGFLVLFLAVGLVFALGGRALSAYFPIGGFAIGLLLVSLALWAIVTNRSLGIPQASRATAWLGSGRGRPFFAFGAAYGVASLACTLPVFLAVVGTSLAAGGMGSALGRFASYAAGMGTMVTAALVGAALFETAVSSWLRRIVPHVHRVAAALLLAAGIYIVQYWATGVFA